MYTEAQAQLCPVCKGEGIIKNNNYSTTSSNIPITKTCHGCDGKGWVTIRLDYKVTYGSK